MSKVEKAKLSIQNPRATVRYYYLRCRIYANTCCPVSNAFHESLPGIIGLVDVVEVEDLRVPKDIQLARNYELLKPRGEYTS